MDSSLRPSAAASWKRRRIRALVLFLTSMMVGCLCVCVCVRARARACVFVCMCFACVHTVKYINTRAHTHRRRRMAHTSKTARIREDERKGGLVRLK